MVLAVKLVILALVANKLVIKDVTELRRVVNKLVVVALLALRLLTVMVPVLVTSPVVVATTKILVVVPFVPSRPLIPFVPVAPVSPVIPCMP